MNFQKNNLVILQQLMTIQVVPPFPNALIKKTEAAIFMPTKASTQSFPSISIES